MTILPGRFIAMIAVSSLVSLAGCTMCDSPYDYTGPVVDAAFHPAGLRTGGAVPAPAAVPEAIPAPPPPPTTLPNSGEGEPRQDTPQPMDDTETASVMRSRLRYAR